MYPSALTDTAWGVLKPLLPSPSPRGRPRLWALRHTLDAIFYILRAGYAWRFLPQDYPPWPTVYHYFRRWQQTGRWQLLHEALRSAVRTKAQRDPLPSAALMDSQSVKTTVELGTIKGYDGHKRVKGRKRHVLVDTLGLLLSVYVTPANTSDRTGAQCLLAGLQPWQPRIVLIRADRAYSGKDLATWCAAEGGWRLEIVTRAKDVHGFVVVPWRWIVERTLAWIDRCRRLSKDYERKVQTSEHLIQIAMIRLMVRRLAR